MQDLYSTKAHHIFLYHTEFFFSEQNVMSQMMSLLNKILYVLHLSWPVTLMESSKIGKKKTKNIITAECTLTGDHCKYRCTNIRLAIFFFFNCLSCSLSLGRGTENAIMHIHAGQSTLKPLYKTDRLWGPSQNWMQWLGDVDVMINIIVVVFLLKYLSLCRYACLVCSLGCVHACISPNDMMSKCYYMLHVYINGDWVLQQGWASVNCW